jgi:hypothetical protein
MESEPAQPGHPACAEVGRSNKPLVHDGVLAPRSARGRTPRHSGRSFGGWTSHRSPPSVSVELDASGPVA